MKNLFHAHVGWLFVSEGRATIEKYVPDLLAERGLRVIHKLFGVWLAVSLLVPALRRLLDRRHLARRARPRCSGAAQSGSSCCTT